MVLNLHRRWPYQVPYAASATKLAQAQASSSSPHSPLHSSSHFISRWIPPETSWTHPREKQSNTRRQIDDHIQLTCASTFSFVWFSLLIRHCNPVVLHYFLCNGDPHYFRLSPRSDIVNMVSSAVQKAWESCDLTDTVSYNRSLSLRVVSYFGLQLHCAWVYHNIAIIYVFIFTSCSCSRLSLFLFPRTMLTYQALRPCVYRFLLAHYTSSGLGILWLQPPSEWHGLFPSISLCNGVLHDSVVYHWLLNRLRGR